MIVVTMVICELRLRINGRRKRGGVGKLKARALQEVRQEGQGEVLVAAYTRIVCLKINRDGSCSYEYKVLVVFRLHFW